mmetsp:Transcript_106513/g.217287  ORF Transcript_106513/g.217287 Transcript_106513/m.217287 type:complete len:104 (-) Transcript_106513:25-336(-)
MQRRDFLSEKQILFEVHPLRCPSVCVYESPRVGFSCHLDEDVVEKENPRVLQNIREPFARQRRKEETETAETKTTGIQKRRHRGEGSPSRFEQREIPGDEEKQ